MKPASNKSKWSKTSVLRKSIYSTNENAQKKPFQDSEFYLNTWVIQGTFTHEKQQTCANSELCGLGTSSVSDSFSRSALALTMTRVKMSSLQVPREVRERHGFSSNPPRARKVPQWLRAFVALVEQQFQFSCPYPQWLTTAYNLCSWSIQYPLLAFMGTCTLMYIPTYRHTCTHIIKNTIPTELSLFALSGRFPERSHFTKLFLFN